MTPRQLLAAPIALLLAAPAGAADPDWPCVQIKVPELSAGAMWAGPPVEAAARTWADDQEVAELVRVIAPRRVAIAEATQRIDAFAEGLATDRDRRLTLLFAGLLDVIDAERRDIIAGIERYARRQAALAGKVKARTAEVRALQDRPEPTAADHTRIQEIERELEWDIRIFEERAQSLSYVCESPVLLEQRLFALARAIMAHLE